jgi:allantoinase
MAKFDVIIRGGHALLPDGERVVDIAVSDGRVVELSPGICGSGRDEIDAGDFQVFPGLIDPHVHFNEPGRTEWEGFATGSAGLAAGGGTCFIEMPLNSSPPTLNGVSFDLKRAAAERSSLTDFALWGGLTPKNLDRLEELAERGVVGFKAFMCDSGMEDFGYADEATLFRGMQIAARLNLPVAVHAESQELTARLSAATRRPCGWAEYLASRPPEAETEAISLAIQVARETGCSLHVVHVSTGAGVELVRSAVGAGIDVTCETCPHYLLLTDSDLERLGARAKCAPPLRSAEESAKLWNLLEAGAIDWIASDHSPAPAEMKSSADAMAVWGGIAGVQSTLHSLLGRKNLGRGKVAKLTAENVAARFGLRGKGRIAVGYDADLVLVDLHKSKTLRREDLQDRHKLSPYVGCTFTGVICRTISRGRTIYQDGKIVRGEAARLLTPAKEASHA